MIEINVFVIFICQSCYKQYFLSTSVINFETLLNFRQTLNRLNKANSIIKLLDFFTFTKVKGILLPLIQNDHRLLFNRFPKEEDSQFYCICFPQIF